MARRRMGPKRSTTILFDLNKICQQIRMIVLEEANGIIGELAERVAAEAKSKAPVLDASELPRGPNKRQGDHKSGPLKDNIFAQPSSKVPGSWIVCSPAWYSHMLEYGTTPHEMPRASYQEEMKQGLRKPMKFKGSDGKWVSATWLYHPGAKRHPFLRPAADKAEQFLEEIIQKRHP